MIQPNLPIPLAFYNRSHFLILLFLSASCFAPWLPSPALSLFYPWAFFVISVSLYLALSPLDPCPSLFRSPHCFSLHFTQAPYSCFYHSLSNRYAAGKWRVPGSNAARWFFVSDYNNLDLWRFSLFFLLLIFTSSYFNSFFVWQTWAMTKCGLWVSSYEQQYKLVYTC